MCTPNLAKVLGLCHSLTMSLCISVIRTITCLDFIVILNVSLSIPDWIYRSMVVVAMVTALCSSYQCELLVLRVYQIIYIS